MEQFFDRVADTFDSIEHGGRPYEEEQDYHSLRYYLLETSEGVERSIRPLTRPQVDAMRPDAKRIAVSSAQVDVVLKAKEVETEVAAAEKTAPTRTRNKRRSKQKPQA